MKVYFLTNKSENIQCLTAISKVLNYRVKIVLFSLLHHGGYVL